MHLLFWDKLEPFVMVINHNGCCKPKFILWFLVRSFYDQFSDRHCRSIRWLLPWIMAFRYALNNNSTGSRNTLRLATA